MLFKKKFEVLLVLLSLSLFTKAQSYQFLTIQFNNKQEAKNLALENLSLAFKNGQMFVKNIDGMHAFNILDIVKMNLTPLSTGFEVHEETHPEAWLNPETNEVILQGKENEVYEFFTPEGLVILKGHLSSPEERIILPFTQPGIFFVRIGDSTFKLLKL